MITSEVFSALPSIWKRALSEVIPDAAAIERIWVADGAEPRLDATVAATADGIYIAKVPPDHFIPTAVFFWADEILAVQANLGSPGSTSEVYIWTPYAPRPGFGLLNSMKEFRDEAHRLAELNSMSEFSNEVRRFAEPNLISFADRELADDLVRYLEAWAASER